MVTGNEKHPDGLIVPSAEAAQQRPPLLRFEGVSKSFHGVQVLNSVSWDLAAATTIGLIGENGAGKSTLMKILAGIHPSGSYDGRILLDGVEVSFASPKDALASGVVYVAQELMFTGNLSIAENMFAGRLPQRFGLVDRARLRAQAVAALTSFGLDLDPEMLAGRVSPATQRLAAIAAALSEKARLLILDEPTASLTENEANLLFDKVNPLRTRNISCIHITHRLDEVEEHTDNVVVLRNGTFVSEIASPKGRRAEMVKAMIGREENIESRPAAEASTTKVMTVSNLRLWAGRDRKSAPRVDGVSFDLHAGEVLGIYGLVGAGRTEMAKALFGAWHGASEGIAEIGATTDLPASPTRAMQRGIAMLPEDRKISGIIRGQSVSNNMSAGNIERFASGGMIDRAGENARNLDYIAALDVRPKRLDINIENLSGGNQQKVLLARCLASDPKVLILDEPTVGVDIGARFEIFRIIRELAAKGRGILLISSDMAEVMAECDRTLVMYKGRITGEFSAGVSRQQLIAAATGAILP